MKPRFRPVPRSLAIAGRARRRRLSPRRPARIPSRRFRASAPRPRRDRCRAGRRRKPTRRSGPHLRDRRRVMGDRPPRAGRDRRPRDDPARPTSPSQRHQQPVRHRTRPALRDEGGGHRVRGGSDRPPLHRRGSAHARRHRRQVGAARRRNDPANLNANWTAGVGTLLRPARRQPRRCRSRSSAGRHQRVQAVPAAAPARSAAHAPRRAPSPGTAPLRRDRAAHGARRRSLDRSRRDDRPDSCSPSFRARTPIRYADDFAAPGSPGCFGKPMACAVTLNAEPGTGRRRRRRRHAPGRESAAEQSAGLAFWVVTADGDRIGYSGLAVVRAGHRRRRRGGAGQALGAATRETRLAWERAGQRVNPFPLLVGHAAVRRVATRLRGALRGFRAIRELRPGQARTRPSASCPEARDRPYGSLYDPFEGRRGLTRTRAGAGSASLDDGRGSGWSSQDDLDLSLRVRRPRVP